MNKLKGPAGLPVKIYVWGRHEAAGDASTDFVSPILRGYIAEVLWDVIIRGVDDGVVDSVRDQMREDLDK